MDTAKYGLKTVSSVSELDRVYDFAQSILDVSQDTVHTREYYLAQVYRTPSLLIYAQREGKVVGCILASIDEDHVLVGPTAVAEAERGQGIGRAMIRQLEAAAKRLNQTTLILGARQEAEGFYARCGYRPNLFIQLPEVGQADRLKQLNTQYPVVWESEEGKWTRLMLSTPQVDRELQLAYQAQFPNCHTQYVFIKEIG